jgi:ribonuclease E
LYWFRTPPGIKVGREPFDEAARRALEANHPNLVFDWKKIVQTTSSPLPPDPQAWRERRTMERAGRRARIAEEAESESLVEPQKAAEHAVAQAAQDVDERAAAAEGASTQAEGAGSQAAEGGGRRRRRRRGGRRRHRPAPSGGPVDAPQEGAVEPPDPGRNDGTIVSDEEE